MMNGHGGKRAGAGRKRRPIPPDIRLIDTLWVAAEKGNGLALLTLLRMMDEANERDRAAAERMATSTTRNTR